MSIDYTSTELINSIKEVCAIPTSQKLFTDDILVKIISREMRSTIVPFIMGMREEYFVANYDQDIDTTQDSYVIPPRAIGQKLKDVVLLDSAGNEIDCPRLSADQIKDDNSQNGFHFENDAVHLRPDASDLGSYDLRMKIFRRPNNICLTTHAGKITIINRVTKQLTLDRIPSSWTTGLVFDLIKGSPTFRSWVDDLAVTSIDGLTKVVTFSATLPTGLLVGDWCCEAGEAPVAQIPYEAHDLLVHRVAVVVMKELGDTEGLKNEADVYNDMKASAVNLLTPRADGSPKKIKSTSTLFD